MIDAYKRFPLKYQIISITALTVVAFFIGWKQDHQPFIVAGFTLALLVMLHLFLTKLNSLLAFIVILVQIVIYSTLIYGVYAYGSIVANMLTIDINLIAIMLFSFGLAMLASYVYVGYRFSRGRLWLNLTTAFILSGMITTIILIINPLFYIAALVVGYVAGLAYLMLRSPNNKKRPQIQRNPLSESSKKKVESLMDNENLTYSYIPSESALAGGHYFAYNDNSAFLITVVVPYKTFTVNSFGIMCDDNNIIPLLEYGQEQIAKEKDLKTELVTPILLVLSPSKNLKPITSVSISKWKQPDYNLGVTHILSTVGFGRFIRATIGELKPLRAKPKEKIELFAQNLTSN